MRRSLVVVALVLAASSARAAPKSSPEAKAIAAVIEDQFGGFRDTKRAATVYTKDAMIAMTGGTSTPQVNKLTHADGKWTLFGPATLGKHKVRDLRVTLAGDGKSAWASFTARIMVDGLSKSGAVDYRATQLFVLTGSSWQVRAAAWSIGVSNATLAKAAKAASLPRLETVFDQNLGDADVIAALRSLPTSALDATASARTDLVSIGTAPRELAIGGKKVAAKHKKEWLDKLTVDGSVWAITAGTTACATANVELKRGAAAIPARLFVVFEKTTAGTWSPVLVHLAAAP